MQLQRQRRQQQQHVQRLLLGHVRAAAGRGCTSGSGVRSTNHERWNEAPTAAASASLSSLLLLYITLAASFLLLALPLPSLAQVALIGSQPAYDVTTHLGVPENAPPAAIEFLGSGYDIIMGNPLDEQGETFIDPGFRLPVIELLFDVRRSAGGFQEPLGTSIKRAPVCKYATLAQEIATVSAYQQFLGLDVTILNEFGMEANLTQQQQMFASSSSTGSGPIPPAGMTGVGIGGVFNEQQSIYGKGAANAPGPPRPTLVPASPSQPQPSPPSNQPPASSQAPIPPNQPPPPNRNAGISRDAIAPVSPVQVASITQPASGSDAAPAASPSASTPSTPFPNPPSSNAPLLDPAAPFQQLADRIAQAASVGNGVTVQTTQQQLPAASNNIRPIHNLGGGLDNIKALDGGTDAYGAMAGFPTNLGEAMAQARGQQAQQQQFAQPGAQFPFAQSESLFSNVAPGGMQLAGAPHASAFEPVPQQGTRVEANSVSNAVVQPSFGPLGSNFAQVFQQPTQPQQQQLGHQFSLQPPPSFSSSMVQPNSLVNAPQPQVGQSNNTAPMPSASPPLAANDGTPPSPSQAAVPPATPQLSAQADGNNGNGGFVIVEPIDPSKPQPTPSPSGSSSTGSSSGSSSGTFSSSTGREEPKEQKLPLGFAFTGSFTFQDVRQTLEQKDQIAFYSRALCVEYTVEFRSFIPPLLTENFVNAIAFLPDFMPDEFDDSDRAADARLRFRSFIQEFGTHYVHKLVAGGKRVVTTLLSAASVAALKQNSVNVFLGAAFMPGGVANASGLSANNFTLALQQQNFEAMSSQIESRVETTIGGLPFINFYGWAATVPDRCTPVQYTLKPLYTLLIPGRKREALKQVLSAYVATAGKYPSIDNRASYTGGVEDGAAGFGSLSEHAPPPTPIFNNNFDQLQQIAGSKVPVVAGVAATPAPGGATNGVNLPPAYPPAAATATGMHYYQQLQQPQQQQPQQGMAASATGGPAWAYNAGSRAAPQVVYGTNMGAAQATPGRWAAAADVLDRQNQAVHAAAAAAPASPISTPPSTPAGPPTSVAPSTTASAAPSPPAPSVAPSTSSSFPPPPSEPDAHPSISSRIFSWWPL